MAEPGELTAEIRFWWRGEAPTAVKSWFEGGRPGDPETRIDTYLLAGNEALGIKRRGEGGGIEIKSLVAVLEVGLPAGPAELWIKAEVGCTDLPPGIALAVTKTRRLRRVLDCEVELGSVRAEGGEQWSSLCFEAGATLDDPTRTLRAVWTELDPPAECGNALAASYPAWLERLARI